MALAREGARLFLVARRERLLRELAGEIRALGGEAHVQVLDLGDAAAQAALIPLAHQALGRIDVLVNNAAFGYFGAIEATPESVVRDIFRLNFDAALRATQDVIPIMRRQGGGHIINVSSVAGKRGLPLSGVYSATKFALQGLSEALRLELEGTRIHVSVVNPSSTRTEFQEALRRGGDVEGRFNPVGHEQTPEDVAAAIVRCIRKPRIEVYPYPPSRFLGWINAIAPSVLDHFVLRAFRDRIRNRRPDRLQ